MTTHRMLPSEVEPEALRELIEDCRHLPPEALPRPRTLTVQAPAGRGATPRIPEPTARLVADLDDYV